MEDSYLLAITFLKSAVTNTKSSMADDAPAVVIDNGTGTIKAGLAGEDVPRAVFPTTLLSFGGPGDALVGVDSYNGLSRGFKLKVCR